jgi:hypothetical protein
MSHLPIEVGSIQNENVVVAVSADKRGRRQQCRGYKPDSGHDVAM